VRPSADSHSKSHAPARLIALPKDDFVITPKRVPNTRRGTELTAQTLSVKGTSTMANFVLPYEPDAVRHIDDEKRRREIKEWLQQLRCEVSVVSPSIVPEVHDRRR